MTLACLPATHLQNPDLGPSPQYNSAPQHDLAPQYDVAGALQRFIQSRWNAGGEARAQIEKVLAEYRRSGEVLSDEAKQ